MNFLLCFRVGEWTIFIDFVCFRFRFSYLVHLHNDSEVSSKGFSFRELFVVVFAKKMDTEVDDQRFNVAVLISMLPPKLHKWTAKWSNHSIRPHSSQLNVQALWFVSPCLWFDLFSPGHRCLSTWWPAKWSSWATQWWFVWVVDQLQCAFNMIQSMMIFYTECSKYMNGNEQMAHAQSLDVSYDYAIENKHWTQKLVVCRYIYPFLKGVSFRFHVCFRGVQEIPSLPLVLLVINCSGHRKPENRLTELRKQRSQEAWKRAYTPDFQHGTWKWWFPIGISFSMGPFSGSMFVLGGVL